MPEWETLRVGDVADVFDGPHATPQKTPEGPWFLSISSLSSGRLNIAESAHLSEDDFVKWTRRVTPQESDVLFSYETRLGEAAIMPAGLKACLGRRMGLLRPRRDKIDPRFLLYAYIAPQFQQVINERSIHGATVDRIPLTELPQWPISVPSLREQKDIAAVLGALDDKIAVNERVYGPASDLAAALFARRFENGAMRQVALGELAEVVDCLHSKKPRSVGGRDYRYLVLDDIREDGRLEPEPNFSISKADYDLWTRRIEVRHGDCVVTNVGRVGAVGQVPEGVRAAVGRNMTAVRGLPGVPPAYLVEALRCSTVRREIDAKTDHGTILSALNVRSIPRLLLPTADRPALQAFQEEVEPLHRMHDNLLRENARLKRVRDALLPGLMSGAIRVRTAESVVEDAV